MLRKPPGFLTVLKKIIMFNGIQLDSNESPIESLGMIGDVLDEIFSFLIYRLSHFFVAKKNQRLHLIHSLMRRMQPSLIVASSPLRRRLAQEHPSLPFPKGKGALTDGRSPSPARP